MFEDDFPFPQVGYVNSLESTSCPQKIIHLTSHPAFPAALNRGQQIPSQVRCWDAKQDGQCWVHYPGLPYGEWKHRKTIENPVEVKMMYIVSPKKPNSSHLKMGRAPKGKDRIPTIHFQGIC